jgi:23S rRNA (adenine2503-C2)-methyltransferase
MACHPSEKTPLKDMALDELTDFFVSIGEKPYRARQVFKWLMNGAASWDEMTDLSLALRERLGGIASIDCLRVVDIAVSRCDGTRKYLFETADGLYIEAVLMEYCYGYSVCVSSQAGCRMGCGFCASGRHGLSRSLTPGEIADQYIMCERDVRSGFVRSEAGGSEAGGSEAGGMGAEGPGETRGEGPNDRPCEETSKESAPVSPHIARLKHRGDDGKPRIGHIVVMGVGEPFDNYDNVMTFLKNVTDPCGRNLGRRQITVSTCGLMEGMRRFMKDLPQANLSLSLHAPNDEIRRRIMPVAATCGVDELLAFAREYSETTGRRFSFEYALFADVNDSVACADELAGMLAGHGFHVNLISANPVPGLGYAPPPRTRVTAFAERLIARGIRTTTRRELGADIEAACGQLRSERMAGSISPRPSS